MEGTNIETQNYHNLVQYIAKNTSHDEFAKNNEFDMENAGMSC